MSGFPPLVGKRIVGIRIEAVGGMTELHIEAIELETDDGQIVRLSAQDSSLGEDVARWIEVDVK